MKNCYMPYNEKDNSLLSSNSNNLRILCPYPFSTELVGVLYDIDKPQTPNATSTTDIYVSCSRCLDQDSSLIKSINALNREIKYNIKINSRNKLLLDYVNPNITVEDNAFELEQSIINSKIIIGTGYAILYAIKHNKPFMVVGESGYSSNITETNFEAHYLNFFQGNICQKSHDTPFIEEINNFMFTANYNPNLRSILEELLYDEFADISTKIKQFKRVRSTSDYDYKIMLNPDFKIIKKSNCYWLLNRFSQQIIATMSLRCYKEIEKFLYHQTTPLTLKNKTIRTLLTNRILLIQLTQQKSPN